MKSTKDNRPAVKFSDIVKELHHYANSEKAIDDFASELEKIINLPEEFELSQYYFQDSDAKNYLRKSWILKVSSLPESKIAQLLLVTLKTIFLKSTKIVIISM